MLSTLSGWICLTSGAFYPAPQSLEGFVWWFIYFFFVVLKIKICLQFINIFLAKLTILSLSQHDYRKANDKVAFPLICDILYYTIKLSTILTTMVYFFLFQNSLNPVFCPLSLFFACLMLQDLKLFNTMRPSRQCIFNNTNEKKFDL